MENRATKEILKVKKLNKSFPGVQALKDVDFYLIEGEIHCLVGENGAGKSTFIEILSGALIPDSGEIILFDERYPYLTPNKSIELGIQTVHQENQLVGSLTGAENIFLSNLKTTKLHLFDLKGCIQEAKKVLKSLDFHLDPAVKVERLSPVEKKVLSIVKTLWSHIKILILDEPTQSLGKEETDVLMRLVRTISSKGIGIIYISHYLDEIFKIADRVTVLKDGEKIGTHEIKYIDKDILIKEMVGKELKSFYVKKETHFDTPAIEIKNYSKKNVVKNVSFNVAEGEVFGIGGMVGSGRTELIRLIFGLDKKDTGTVVYKGKDITPTSPRLAIENGIGMLTEDKKEQGLILERSVIENITVVKLNNTRTFLLHFSEERRDTKDLIDKLKIRTPSMYQKVVNLSGGNQQKVVLAKWLLCNSNILLLDEPTLGIDVGTKEEIYSLISEMTNQGKIIILVSSDMDELLSICDTIGIMRDGEMVKIIPKREISQELFLSYAIGGAK